MKRKHTKQLVYSKHFPINGPWDSAADKAALQNAENHFTEMKAHYPYLRLVCSHHPYTQGYWVESSQGKVKLPDYIMQEFKQ